jgi:protein involved in polysaccharide export with SLBB domain
VVNLGFSYGQVRVAGLTIGETEQAVRARLKQVLREPVVTVTWAGPLSRLQPTHLRVGTVVRIQTENAGDIQGTVTVEAGGTVPLGPRWGRVKVAGLTPEEAEQAIVKHLKGRGLAEPLVLVTFATDRGATLEERVRRLEQELSELRRR